METAGPSNAGTSAPHFYDALGPDEIRLLKVRLEAHDAISCDMQTFSASVQPAYSALSYVWGKQRPSLEIMINKTSFFVTPNLRAALVGLHSPDVHKGRIERTWLWVDAICINQIDLNEKAVQVARMSTVFGNATQVPVWLGDENPGKDASGLVNLMLWLTLESARTEFTGAENDGIVKSLQAIQAKCETILGKLDVSKSALRALSRLLDERKRQAVEDEADVEIGTMLTEFDLASSLPDPDSNFWVRLLSFLDHPWFSRIWTLQEGHLARRLYPYSATLPIQWATLKQTCTLLFGVDCQEVLYSHTALRDIGSSKSVFSCYDLHTIDLHTIEPARRLQVLLLGLRNHQATNPKDYIYGILGILDEENRTKIHVDYTQNTTTATLFAQAIRLAYHAKNGPFFWHELMVVYGDVKRLSPDRLSWVPDFGCTSVNVRATPPPLHPEIKRKHEHLARLHFQPASTIAVMQGLELATVSAAMSCRIGEGQDHDPRSAERCKATCLDQALNPACYISLFGEDQHTWLLDFKAFVSADAHDDIWPWLRRLGSVSFINQNSADVFDNPYLSYKKLEDMYSVCAVYGLSSVAELIENLRIEPLEGVPIATVIELFTAGAYAMFAAKTLVDIWYLFRTSEGRLGMSSHQPALNDQVVYIAGGEHLHLVTPAPCLYKGFVWLENCDANDQAESFGDESSGWRDFAIH